MQPPCGLNRQIYHAWCHFEPSVKGNKIRLMWLGSDWQLVGGKSVIGRGSIAWELVDDCFWRVCIQGSRKDYHHLKAGRQPLVELSATKNCARVVCNHCNYPRHVVNQCSALTTKHISRIKLVAKRFRLQQTKFLSDQIVQATSLQLRQHVSHLHVCDLPANPLPWELAWCQLCSHWWHRWLLLLQPLVCHK